MSAWVLRSALRRLHNSASSNPLPSPRLTKFKLLPPKSVEVEFSDGASFNLSAEFLRVHSPAADSKIRSVGGEKVIYGRCYVGIMSAEQVGNYGVRILFDDLHKTGIFTWDYLHHLGANKFTLMRNYIKTLKKHGLSRDPRVNKKCTTGFEHDVLIEVEKFSFYLHKFPLVTRSPYLLKVIKEYTCEENAPCTLTLHEIPGGAYTFEIIAKFCYGEKIELTSSNIVPVLCAAYYLNMTEDSMEENLISQAENFLSKILSNWDQSFHALLFSEDVLLQAEELSIVSRCLNSLVNQVIHGKNYLQDKSNWNIITYMGNIFSKSKGSELDWWFADVCSLSLYLFKRFIRVLDGTGHDPVNISNAVMYYSSTYYHGSDPGIWSIDQRTLLEEIVNLLPVRKGATTTNHLLNMLCKGIMLNANATCIRRLEKRIIEQLDGSTLEDLLEPNYGDKSKAAINIDCILRITEQFMQRKLHASNIYNPQLDKVARVAELVDGYLVKVAAEVNLKMEKLQSLASVVPENVRLCHDNLYLAINAYIEHHPQLSEQQKEQLCQLLDIQKLSRDICKDAAQNGKLPLRIMVKVLHAEIDHLNKSLVKWAYPLQGRDMMRLYLECDRKSEHLNKKIDRFRMGGRKRFM